MLLETKNSIKQHFWLCIILSKGKRIVVIQNYGSYVFPIMLSSSFCSFICKIYAFVLYCSELLFFFFIHLYTGYAGVTVATSMGIFTGAEMSKNIASFLEENDLFVPSDDDDDD